MKSLQIDNADDFFTNLPGNLI
jgi:hypothetical protein